MARHRLKKPLAMGMKKPHSAQMNPPNSHSSGHGNVAESAMRLFGKSMSLMGGVCFAIALASIPLEVAWGEEDVAFFGLAKTPGGTKAAELLRPMLPEGMPAVRFGMVSDVLIAHRRDSPTKKIINVGQLCYEELENENRKPESLLFYVFRYGHSDDKKLDSIEMNSFYDDKEFKFPKVRILLSASFQSFGRPSRVIKVKSHGSDKVPVMFIYWKSGEYNIELWLARSIDKSRMNIQWVARIPHKNNKTFVPENGEESTPDATAFGKLYDDWFKETAKR